MSEKHPRPYLVLAKWDHSSNWKIEMTFETSTVAYAYAQDILKDGVIETKVVKEVEFDIKERQ